MCHPGRARVFPMSCDRRRARRRPTHWPDRPNSTAPRAIQTGGKPNQTAPEPSWTAGNRAPTAGNLARNARKPIQTAWLYLVLPALLLNYFGQGALVLLKPETISNPFYLLFPDWALYPMVALASRTRSTDPTVTTRELTKYWAIWASVQARV